jgi:hypothetical protein
MTLPTIILMNAGAAISLLVILTAAMRLPFGLPHPPRAARAHRKVTQRSARRVPRRSWSELPDQA